MTKVSLTFKQLLGFIIHGLKVGNYDAALSLAEEYYEQMPDDQEPPAPGD